MLAGNFRGPRPHEDHHEGLSSEEQDPFPSVELFQFAPDTEKNWAGKV